MLSDIPDFGQPRIHSEIAGSAEIVSLAGFAGICKPEIVSRRADLYWIPLEHVRVPAGIREHASLRAFKHYGLRSQLPIGWPVAQSWADGEGIATGQAKNAA